MNHRRAVFTMLAVTLMWSIAGVVTRQLESARSFEVTFWRSAITALTLGIFLPASRGPRAFWRSLRVGGRTLLFSAGLWCVMFTAFMLAMTLTTVANVLVTLALSPLLTALLARAWLGHRLAHRTAWAIVVAGSGIAWMYAREVQAADARHLLGTAVAFLVPCAAATNWTLIQRTRGRSDVDLVPAVLLGALLSTAITLPWAFPTSASTHDLLWLGVLGVFQLAIPCLLSVLAGRHLSAPEAALLALLEVVFGVAWAWIGAGETPRPHVLAGGALVLTALAVNEVAALRGGRDPAPAE
jgi:drug/metabolite transporter (DMT)-like permease